MSAQRRLTLWLVVLSLSLLSGCGEVFNEYYISNHTDAELRVQLTPVYLDTVDLLSGPLIPDIRTSERSSLAQPVGYEQAGDTVRFIIPAKSSVYLGFSSGGNDLFSELELTSNNAQLMMDNQNYHEHFAVHDRLIGAVVHVLNVK